jgi:hypothetical protein
MQDRAAPASAAPILVDALMATCPRGTGASLSWLCCRSWSNRGRTRPSTDLSLATHPRPEAEHEPSKRLRVDHFGAGAIRDAL